MGDFKLGNHICMKKSESMLTLKLSLILNLKCLMFPWKTHNPLCCNVCSGFGFSQWHWVRLPLGHLHLTFHISSKNNLSSSFLWAWMGDSMNLLLNALSLLLNRFPYAQCPLISYSVAFYLTLLCFPLCSISYPVEIFLLLNLLPMILKEWVSYATGTCLLKLVLFFLQDWKE